MKPLLTEKNAAVGQLQVIKGGRGMKSFTDPYSPVTVAKSKAGRVSDTASTKKKLSGLSSGERKTLWYAVGISILLIVLFVLAVKYKYIKLQQMAKMKPWLPWVVAIVILLILIRGFDIDQLLGRDVD